MGGDDDHMAICPEKLVTTIPISVGSWSLSKNHVVIPVEEMMMSEANKKKKGKEGAESSNINGEESEEADEKSDEDEDEDGVEKGECRYCHDDDYVTKLETPCLCTGSLKFAHRSCTQRWINTKGDTICEICRKPYGPNFTVTERLANDDDESLGWRIPGTNRHIYSPLVLAEMATDRVAAALNDDCNFRNPSGGVICGTGLIIFLVVLLVRDAYYYNPPQKEDRVTNFVLCGLVIVLAPLYILTWIFEWRGRDRSD